jgi:hypothetical protein
MRKNTLLLTALMVFTLFALYTIPIQAHSPSNMTLTYDFNSQILTVTVVHSVADVNTHYIEQIVINKNGQYETDRTYSSQASTTSMSDTFAITAANNDVLQVTAICSISGQIARQITVSSGGLQTQDPPPIPGFPMFAIALGLVAALGITLLRRQKNART